MEFVKTVPAFFIYAIGTLDEGIRGKEEPVINVVDS